ncbi:MAG: DUF6252 family protein [Bacteroidia bacterium]
MVNFRQYFIVLIALCTGIAGCHKDSTANPVNPNYLSATNNNTDIVFNGSVSAYTNEYTITGVTSSNSKIQLTFEASNTGIIKLGALSGGQATFTSSTGEVWQTNFSDTGSVVITTLNTATSTIAGTFSFTGNETKPTANASTLTITDGSFYLTW